jgi:dsRNA-specific ribonuclease
MAQPAPNTLQAALGYTFREPQLLVKALTHSSLAYEQTLEGRQAVPISMKGNGHACAPVW